MSSSLEPDELRRTFACFPSGVTALCGLDSGNPVGMAASSFCSVSLDPPLALVCVSQTSSTWEVLRRLERIGVSVLSSGHDGVARHLAGPAQHRFSSVEWTPTSLGSVLIDGAIAWLDCSLEQEVPAGDHHIAVLRIHGAKRAAAQRPLVFHDSRFHDIAPTEPPSA